jgi:hypothetical protein
MKYREISKRKKSYNYSQEEVALMISKARGQA